MMYAIVKKLVNTIKNYVPELKHVHFWTDSPSSQYRNKSVFDLITRFKVDHGCKASWHYFESGIEESADNAVKQEKAVIQDVMDCFSWSTQSEGEIEYQLITTDDKCRNRRKESGH